MMEKKNRCPTFFYQVKKIDPKSIHVQYWLLAPTFDSHVNSGGKSCTSPHQLQVTQNKPQYFGHMHRTFKLLELFENNGSNIGEQKKIISDQFRGQLANCVAAAGPGKE